jgi:hypothetical protein
MVSAGGAPPRGRTGARCPVGQGAGGRGKSRALWPLPSVSLGPTRSTGAGGETVSPVLLTTSVDSVVTTLWSLGVSLRRARARAQCSFGGHRFRHKNNQIGILARPPTRLAYAIAGQSATGRISAAAGGPRPTRCRPCEFERNSREF